MRKIKFAAKKKDDRGWVYGYFVEKLSGFYIEYKNEKGRYAFLIDRETVCQYTGIDTNYNVEIYEGDYVESKGLIPGVRDFKGTVKFLEGAWVIDNGEDAVPLWREGVELRTNGNIHNE